MKNVFDIVITQWHKMFGMPSYIICLFDGVYFDAWILELSLGKHLLIAIKIKVDTLLVIFRNDTPK